MSEERGLSDTQEQGTETERGRGAIKRRGLIAGVAALVATAIASKATSQEEVAAAGGNGNPVILGGDASGSGLYQIGSARTWIATGGNAQIGQGVILGTNGFADVPDNHADGVQGMTIGAGNAGVFGRNNILNGVGTWGEAPSGTGAFGDSGTGSGVAGLSSSGAGVYGQSDSGYGVFGLSDSNYGVIGQSTKGIGLYGLSFNSFGVLGVTKAGNPFSGLTGQAFVSGASAVAGSNTASGGYAGYFTGDVIVDGQLIVKDPTKKHGAIKASNGQYRLLYSMESPEPWLEDFGTGTLVNGKAEVKLDPTFTDVIHADQYHVFITQYDDNHALFVANRSTAGFEVHAKDNSQGAGVASGGRGGAPAGGSGSAGGTFSWRIVAKPKSDNKAERLATVDIPPVRIPTEADHRAAVAALNTPKPRR